MKTDALGAINKLSPCRTHDEAYAFYKRFGAAPDGWYIVESHWNIHVREDKTGQKKDYLPWDTSGTTTSSEWYYSKSDASNT